MKRIWLSLVALVLGSTSAHAIPNTINYQGQLFLNGAPTSGPVAIVFRMFDAEAGGVQLWTETDTVTVSGGLFTTALGDGAAFPATLFSAQVPWLEMEVNGQLLTPRKRFQSVPYALNAPPAAGNELWQSDGTNVWREGGRVGINVSSPTSVLDIHSTTGDHNINSIHYSATNPKIKLDALAAGNHQSEVQFQKNGTTRWSLLNDVYGDDQHNIGFKDIVNGLAPLTVDGNGNVNIGSGYADPFMNVRGTTEVSKAGVAPDTRVYSTFGVTRDNAPGSFGYIGMTKFGHVPWAMGIGSGDNFIVGVGSPGQTIPIPHLSIGAWTGNVGIANTNPQARLDIGVHSGYELQFSGNGVGNIYTPSGDMFLNAGTGWSIVLGANGVSQQLVLGANTATINGNAQINGNLNVSGTKCRVVEDSHHGKLYFNAVESANALFSLEGEAKLSDGTAQVALDPKWLAGVTIDQAHPMQVWITFYGPHGNYYIDRATTHFRVVDPSGSDATFGWKVEARQRGYEGVYLNQPTITAAR